MPLSRSADVRHHTHPVLFSLWHEAFGPQSRLADGRCFQFLLCLPVLLPLGPFHLPGGRLHRPDRLHGLAGGGGRAAVQWPVDVDQAVGLCGRHALHGVGPHHRAQRVLLPRALLALHHHGHLLRGTNADCAVGRGDQGWGGLQEEELGAVLMVCEHMGYISGAVAAFTPERDLHFSRHTGDVDFASLKHYFWELKFFSLAFSEYSLLQCGVHIRKLRLSLQ